MTDADHRELLAVLLRCQGKVILSGYPSRLYDEMLAGWTRKSSLIDNKASSAKVKEKKEEVLWLNYQPPVNGN
jgi:DNA adenine methylase